jgi:hypothetical protein
MSLTELFTPTFFTFLGTLLLIVALVVIYFENKMRDQNHKIASMLSLVSTLAEDMNRVKMGMNHLAMNAIGGSSQDQLNTAFISNENKITVSDDEDDSDDDASEIDDNEELSDNEDDEDDSESDSDSSSHDDIKVLKLNISKEPQNDDNEDIDETLDLDATDEIDDLEDLDDNLSDLHSEISHITDSEEKIDNHAETHVNLSASGLKTISINLEETQSESLDYKKLPLPKLRNIVAEKGLSSDASKLKKNELLKLLECE